MVKTIHVNASYDHQNHIFNCPQHEFLDKAAERFNIDMREVVLYAVNKGERFKIKPHDITDLMKIEIVHKKAMKGDGQRTLRSYYGNESTPEKSLVDHIITKLTNNTPLSGTERKSMVEWLKNYSTDLPKKRKIGDIDSKADIAHKKVQVNISSTHSKDSFAQTDFLNVEQEKKSQDEPISTKIKKLAVNGTASKKEIEKLMNTSFDERRRFILVDIPPVTIVKDKYPSLFSFEEVKNELERIFYPGKCLEFLNNVTKYSALILEKCNPSDEIYVRAQKSIERAHTEVQKSYARTVGSIFALTKLLEEDWRFIHLSDYPHGSSDIYPHIDASFHSLKELFFDNLLYHIMVEGQKLCEAPNLPEAILCLIAAFFIFNIDYPNSCRRTLIVFEKLFLCANDTTDIDELTSQMIKLLQLQVKSK